jgi:acyl-CoA thioesterase FadM
MVQRLQVLTRLVRSHFAARSGGIYTSVRGTLVAWPWLCDYNGHVNHVAYLELAELGRADWAGRNGLLLATARHRLRMIIGAIGITYRREIRRFESFRVDTTLAGHDDKWLFFAHEFMALRVSKAIPAARVHVQVRVRPSGGDSLSVAALQELCGLSLDLNRPYSEELKSWVCAAKASATILTRQTADAPIAAES